MKMYSNDAVTASAVNELNDKQTRQIDKLKLQVKALAAGEVALLLVMLGLYFS